MTLDVGCGIHKQPGSIGIELVASEFRDRVLRQAFERGLLVLGAGDNTLRLCPPLVITRDQCDFALDTLEACLTEAAQSA